MAGGLAAVPDESMDGSVAAYPPRSPYRDLIRCGVVSLRSTLFPHSQPSHSGSSYSSDSASNSYPSNSSGCCSGSAAAVELDAQKLSTIARRMVSDGYIQRMVQAYSDASPEPAALGYNGDLMNNYLSMPGIHVCSDDQNRVLETWFFELDVDWVLQIQQKQVPQWKLRFQDNSGSSLQDFVERWVRGLTVIIHGLVEVQSTRLEMMAVKRFGEASIFKMGVFVDAMVPVWKAENLRIVLDMYICVHRAMDIMKNSAKHSELVHFPLLDLAASKLKEAISSTMKKVRTLVEDDDSWSIELSRGGGGAVHKNTRWIAGCIVCLREAHVSLSFLSNNSYSIYDMRYATISYLKDLLVRKSELLSDPSLRYLFLLNNSHFAAQMIEPCQPGDGWKLTPECKKYMHWYLDASWGHVHIPKSHFPGPRWINTSSLTKFVSAFNRTYQAQKFWKVPDPMLRDVLRRAIAERVISSYHDYLKEHPELVEHARRISSTPSFLKEMLGELFEG